MSGLVVCNLRVISMVLVVGRTTIKTGNPHFNKCGVRSDLNSSKSYSYIGYWLSAPNHPGYMSKKMGKPAKNSSVLFILPALLVVGGSFIVPLIAIIIYSVQDIFYGNDFIWVGTKWFAQVLSSKTFYATLFRTLAFSTLVMIIEVPLGILIALCLPRKGHLVPVYLIAIAIPLMIPWVVVGLIWSMMIHPEWGSFGALLSLINLTIDVNNTFAAWFVVVFVDVWHWTSLVVLLCFSGLLAIP